MSRPPFKPMFLKPKEDGIRYYEKDGEKYPSVTSILGLLDKKALVPWAAKCVAEYTAARIEHNVIYTKHDIVKHLTECRNAWIWESDKATSIGTRVHDMVEGVVNPVVMCTQQVTCTEDENCMCAFYEWMREHDVVIVETESEVYGNGYAGRLDIIAYIDGVLTLVDIKTSKSIYREYRLQVAAYAKAWNVGKPSHAQIKAVAILRLCKSEGKPEYKDCTKTIERDYVDFLVMAMFFATHKARDLHRAVKLLDEIDDALYSMIEGKGAKRPVKQRAKKETKNVNSVQGVLNIVNSVSVGCNYTCDFGVPFD